LRSLLLEPGGDVADRVQSLLLVKEIPAADEVDRPVETCQLAPMLLEVALVSEQSGIEQLDERVELERVQLHRGRGEHQVPERPAHLRVRERLGQAVQVRGAVVALALPCPPGVVRLVDHDEVQPARAMSSRRRSFHAA